MIDQWSGHFALSPRERRFAPFRGQVAACRRELSDLLTGDEHHVVAHFARMVVDTAAALGSGEFALWAATDRGSAGCPSRNLIFEPGVPDRVSAGWDAWLGAWNRLVDRNPRLALAGRIADVGERIDGQSWPFGREDAPLRWIDGGRCSPLAWRTDVGADVIGHEYEELRRIRAETGGWVWWDVARHARVFRPDAADTGSRV